MREKGFTGRIRWAHFSPKCKNWRSGSRRLSATSMQVSGPVPVASFTFRQGPHHWPCARRSSGCVPHERFVPVPSVTRFFELRRTFPPWRTSWTDPTSRSWIWSLVRWGRWVGPKFVTSRLGVCGLILSGFVRFWLSRPRVLSPKVSTSMRLILKSCALTRCFQPAGARGDPAPLQRELQVCCRSGLSVTERFRQLTSLMLLLCWCRQSTVMAVVLLVIWFLGKISLATFIHTRSATFHSFIHSFIHFILEYDSFISFSNKMHTSWYMYSSVLYANEQCVQKLQCQLLHSFIRFIRFIHSFVRSTFARELIHSFIHSFIHLFVSLIRSFHSLWIIHVCFIHLFVSFIHSFIFIIYFMLNSCSF